MFDEEEPGKPRNWGWTICIITAISIFNICIFVAIRILLDSENEFDEPLIQGQLREDLTKFVGFFALTFCFGCWCCFCCAGHCMSWTILCHNNDESKISLTNCWRQMLRHTIVRRPTLLRRKRAEQVLTNASSNNIIANNQQVVRDIKFEKHEKQKFKNDRERIFDESDDNILFDATQQKITLKKISGEGEDVTQIARPTTIFAPSKVEFVDELQEVPTTKIEEEQLNSAMTLQETTKEKKQIGVRNVNFLQVPVQMMTPSTVAIIDKGLINQAFLTEHSDKSTQK